MNGNGNQEKIQLLQPYEFDLFNRKLKELYGALNLVTPYFRLIWSEDALELRRMTISDEGFELATPEVRKVRKYPDKKARYVLEGLVQVPESAQEHLVTLLSYEPIWTFEDKHGNYLIPIWPAIHHIMETLKANVEGRGHGIDESQVLGVKETDDPQEAAYLRQKRLNELYQDLFGNETPITDSLARKSGIIVPDTKEKE